MLLLPHGAHVVTVGNSRLLSRWGQLEVKLFASVQAHLCCCYSTIQQVDNQAFGRDMSHLTWDVQLMWAFPPPYLVPQTLMKLVESKRALNLIAPWWSKAVWLGEGDSSVDRPFSVASPSGSLPAEHVGLLCH